MKRLSLVLSVSLAAALTAGCFGYRTQEHAGPETTGIGALLGTWTSASLIPQPGQCTDKWDVTEQTGNERVGTFSATCAGDFELNGTAKRDAQRIPRQLECGCNGIGTGDCRPPARFR